MTQGFEIILGALLPPLIDVLNKKIQKDEVRYLVSVAICIIVGVITNLQTFTIQDILKSVTLIFVSAQSVYNLYWKESEVRNQEIFRKSTR
jgi:xanthine/uracil permease